MAGRSACSARQFVASIDGSKEEAPDGGKLTREIATKSLDVWNGPGLRKPPSRKVPFEVICLAEAVLTGAFAKAYLVVGGEGWKLRKFYTEDGLTHQLVHADKVEILTIEAFVVRAYQGKF